MTVGPRPKSAVVVGAGPGLGLAVARRLGRDGRPVGLVARRLESLQALAADLQRRGDVHRGDYR